MKRITLIGTAFLAMTGLAQAQFNGNGNGNGNTGILNGNFNGNGGGAGSGVGIGLGVGIASAQGGTASASNTVSYKNQRQAPGIGLAGLAMGGLSCKGSATIGLSLPGGAGGIGFPVADDECERRQWAGMLASAKDPRARALAWAIMQRSTIIQQALADTGYADKPAAVRGGNARVIASGCRKWSGGSPGAGVCVY